MKSRVIKIVSLLMAVISVMSLCACEVKPLFETETTTEKVIVDKTPITGERTAALAYFNKIVNALKEEKPNASSVIERSASGFECEDEVLKANLSGLADKVLDKVKGGYAHDDAEADFNEFMTVKGEPWVSQLTVSDINNILWLENSKEEYQIIILLGEQENPEKGKGAYGKSYDITTKDYIMNAFDITKDYFTLDDYNTVYHDGKIICNIDRETDRVKTMVYIKNVSVTANGTGVNALESIGEQTITFELSERYDYGFDYSYLEPATEENTAK